ncbi:ATP-binding protein [Aquiflexum sp.]|uniref:sensor histidine kinase n=1 Tax=Aquiflexum sp. TaxID=1872584 RepID=UPI0035940782
MKLWDKYKKTLNRNFQIKGKEDNSLDYWKNKLFCQTVIYILPFSLIALIPGIYFSWINGLGYLIAVDIFCVALIISIGFLPKLSIQVRQGLFIFCVYFIATTFLYLIGITGPGLVYLLGATFFFIIIFPNKYAYYPSIINIIICGLIAGLIPFDILPWSDSEYHNQAQWLASSSNLIFLGFLSSALIPMVFKGLESALHKEKNIRSELNHQNQVLETALKELKNKNSDLEAFAFSASHDLQEPLRMISSFLTQLQKKYADQLDEKGNQYIFFAVDGAKRMRQIIMDLLEYSRVGKFDGKKEWIDFTELINQVISLNKKLISEKSVSITTKNLPKLYVHRTPLYQIFQNLISNAIKYGENDIPPKISIEGEDLGQEWAFSIKDNGIGIKAEYFDKIFVIFQRLHGKNEYEGSGMGLSIVKKIVENIGGKIWVESELKKGSTFIFTIPKKSVN